MGVATALDRRMVVCLHGLKDSGGPDCQRASIARATLSFRVAYGNSDESKEPLHCPVGTAAAE